MAVNLSAANLMCICIDQTGAQDFGGRAYHRYRTDEQSFKTSQQLLMAMEQFFNQINLPQASTLERTFFSPAPAQPIKKIDKIQDVENMMDHKGDLATFVIHVQYRQNATWQGKIIWTDKKSECSFRSALEMIKLMDQAVESSDSQSDSSDTKRKQ